MSRLKVYSLTNLVKSRLVSESRSKSRCRSARWWLAPRLTFGYCNQSCICFTNTRNYCHWNKYMCWHVFSNKYIYNRLCVLQYIVLWTQCAILVVTIVNSRPGAPMNSDVATVHSRWRHNCCHWLWVKNTSHRPSNDAIWDLRHDLSRDLTESGWFPFVNTTWLGPRPSFTWEVLSQVSSQDW